jgi:hypothetical protein
MTSKLQPTTMQMKMWYGSRSCTVEKSNAFSINAILKLLKSSTRVVLPPSQKECNSLFFELERMQF